MMLPVVFGLFAFFGIWWVYFIYLLWLLTNTIDALSGFYLFLLRSQNTPNYIIIYNHNLFIIFSWEVLDTVFNGQFGWFSTQRATSFSSNWYHSFYRTRTVLSCLLRSYKPQRQQSSACTQVFASHRQESKGSQLCSAAASNTSPILVHQFSSNRKGPCFQFSSHVFSFNHLTVGKKKYNKMSFSNCVPQVQGVV